MSLVQLFTVENLLNALLVLFPDIFLVIYLQFMTVAPVIITGITNHLKFHIL